MNAKQSKALEVCYSNSCAGKRLGLPPGAVEEIKRRNRRDPQSGEGISDVNGKIGVGGFEIGGSLDGDISLSVPGISLSIEDNGEGSLRLPGGIRMDVVKDGCYFVKNFYVANQLAYQDVELDPDCEEESPDEEESPEEELDTDYDDSDLPEDENDSKFDEDIGEGFDEGDEGISDNDLVLAIYGYRIRENITHDYYLGVFSNKIYQKRDNMTRYQVVNTAVRQGVRYPTKIEYSRSFNRIEIVYRRDGSQDDTSNAFDQTFVDNISYAFSPPECGKGVGRFVMGLGRTIKDGARQKRQAARSFAAPLGNPTRGTGYEGHQRLSIDGEFVDVCPRSWSYTGIANGQSDPNTRRFFSSSEKLLYYKVIRGREEKGKIGGNPGKEPLTMDKKCCKMLKEIHEALAVKELNDEGFQIPGRLIAPNAKQSIKADNYLKILALQFQAADHLGLHPFKASLTDANAAQAGNQKVEIQFASGTAGLRQVVELLLENKGDAAARLNLQVRTAVAIAQILKVATITSKTASAIASFVGMPLKEKLSKIKMPFDISLGKRRQLKGFDPGQQKEQAIEAIGMNEEAATEEILPEFLQTGEQPYVHESYDGNFPNLIEQLKGQGRNGL